nr:glycosyltransferase family 2 protein [Dermatophilus congolensis]
MGSCRRGAFFALVRPSVDSVSSASIVIPAYNEGKVIGRCLDALVSTGIDAEIVVAVNGSTDNTAEIARSYDNVRVIDIAMPGKANALNEGDRVAQAFPRIFLDADIVLGPGALAAMVETLTTSHTRVAAPQVRFNSAGASWAVKQYYEVYERTPYVTQGLVGLGVYGLSRSARSRFREFPALQADDLFIQRLFAPAERITTAGWFEVQTPRTLKDLVRVRTRVARGNAVLAASSHTLPAADYSPTTTSTFRSLGDIVRHAPHLAPGAAIYTSVVTAARLRARRSSTAWHRDESTR